MRHDMNGPYSERVLAGETMQGLFSEFCKGENSIVLGQWAREGLEKGDEVCRLTRGACTKALLKANETHRISCLQRKSCTAFSSQPLGLASYFVYPSWSTLFCRYQRAHLPFYIWMNNQLGLESLPAGLLFLPINFLPNVLDAARAQTKKTYNEIAVYRKKKSQNYW